MLLVMSESTRPAQASTTAKIVIGDSDVDADIEGSGETVPASEPVASVLPHDLQSRKPSRIRSRREVHTPWPPAKPTNLPPHAITLVFFLLDY